MQRRTGAVLLGGGVRWRLVAPGTRHDRNGGQRVLTEVRKRGVVDVYIAAYDGLKGLPEAIRTFPIEQAVLSGLDPAIRTHRPNRNASPDAPVGRTAPRRLFHSDRILGTHHRLTHGFSDPPAQGCTGSGLSSRKDWMVSR
jgi:hypothetical protein